MQLIDYDVFISKCNIIIDSCNENMSQSNYANKWLCGRKEGIMQLMKFIDSEVLELTDLMNDYGQQEHEAMSEAYD